MRLSVGVGSWVQDYGMTEFVKGMANFIPREDRCMFGLQAAYVGIRG